MERRSREGHAVRLGRACTPPRRRDDDVVLPGPGRGAGLGAGARGRRRRRPDGSSPRRRPGLIAGYTIVNDLGTVDEFRRTDIPWGFDWMGKTSLTSSPAGPFVVPARFFTPRRQHPHHAEGQRGVMQDWPTDDMIFDPAQFIYASVVPGHGKHTVSWRDSCHPRRHPARAAGPQAPRPLPDRLSPADRLGRPHPGVFRSTGERGAPCRTPPRRMSNRTGTRRTEGPFPR